MTWTKWANAFLGAWLAFVATSHGASALLTRHDLVLGILIGALAVSDLKSDRAWKRWSLAAAGSWLLFAPLIFWAKSASIFNNHTLVGTGLIIFSTALPSQTNAPNEDPPGWSYNPSSWHHRVPVVILAFFGFFVARHMAAFQLGYIETIRDPFFGDGTINVLTSEVAKFFPISDAGLGAGCYLLEGLSGLIGDKRRWRTMPWMVYLFFVLVVPAGVVSILLIMLQPVVVGAWCTLCLVTAVITLLSIPPAVDEVFASTQFLIEQRKKNLPLWKSFWTGDRSEHSREKKPSAPPMELHFLNGLNYPWNLALSTVLGVWIIVSPFLFNLPKTISDSNCVSGAIATTFAVLAVAEVIRSVRFINVAAGAWLIASPFMVGTFSGAALACQILPGLALVLLSLPKGSVYARYGMWDRIIR